MKYRQGFNPLGEGRVLAPPGALPQAAQKLDPELPLFQDEAWIGVEKLNLDSASFRQLRAANSGDARAIAQNIRQIVEERGKMQNPVTGSGGMLLGRVEALGPQAPTRFKVGDRIATLISLTLTPLKLEAVEKVDPDSPQVDVRGQAVLFASAPAALLPKDFSERAALAIFDVCGAPAWARRLVRSGDKVLILGGGHSGALCAAAVSGSAAELWFSDVSEAALEKAVGLGFAKSAFAADAQAPLGFRRALESHRAPAFDFVINCCNAPETETASILAARAGGKVLFFNMATQFNRAVLSAEGLGRDVELIMGNGYAEGHAGLALDLVRRHERLRRFFEG
ncbi:MAG TPA: L-erythro-3,5-diaminohexanoate dehydrogenase [bacterium]|nr:L-erythro-3,5-diaminohexanoate dehydrogenase [bacterium]